MQKVSRRAVIRGGAAVLGVAALGFDSVVGGSPASATPSRSDYTSAIGTVFEATGEGRTHRLRLTSADDTSPAGASAREQSFVLVFEPVSADRPADGIYALRGGAPTHDLYLSAVGADRAMAAVVNGQV